MANSEIIIFMLLVLTYNTCLALQCYACMDQDNNNGDCIAILQNCSPKQDTCYSDVMWRAMPHWQRRFYINKGCTTSKKCESDKLRALPDCKYDSLEDWQCVECCSKDKCNYNVTLSGNSKRSNVLLILSSAVTAIISQYVLR